MILHDDSIAEQPGASLGLAVGSYLASCGLYLETPM